MKTPVIIAAAALLWTGCATPGDGTPEDIAPALKTAAYVGTYYALQEHPEWITGFHMARQELTALAEQDQIDFASILAIVHRLPVDELRSSDAQVIITTATILLAGYGDRTVELDKLPDFKPVALALAEGIWLALQPPPGT